MMKNLLRCCAFLLTALMFGAPAMAAEPAQVVVGSYINKIQDLNFKENKYALDFFIWFRWKPEGALADYKPLDSFEIINGKIENKGSIVEKKIQARLLMRPPPACARASVPFAIPSTGR